VINKVEEVHFNTALLSIGDWGALCYKEKNMIKEKNKLTENESAYVDETDFSRIRSHVMNEVEEEKKEKYVQLEFEFDEDLVASI
jgi:hypothetical protein